MWMNELSVSLDELLALLDRTASENREEPDLITLIRTIETLEWSAESEIGEQNVDGVDSLDKLIGLAPSGSMQLNYNGGVCPDDGVYIDPRAAGEPDLLTLLNQ
jgi:hypothetical protein